MSPDDGRITLLAISGSLRSASSNTAILQAACDLAPPSVSIERWQGLATLPHFNPDLDDGDVERLPLSVAELRRQVGGADGLVISTPEYAHGLPGALKNALDWLVGSTEFPGKTAAVINPSARSVHAQAQLREVLATMSARLTEPAVFVIDLPRRGMTAAEILEDTGLTATLRGVLAEIEKAARAPADH